jgi:hypothetical protein
VNLICGVYLVLSTHPTPESLFMFNLHVLAFGILDFIYPQFHLGSFILTIIGLFIIIHYIIKHNDKPYTEKINYMNTDGTTGVFDLHHSGGPTIWNLFKGIGLILISVITWEVPCLRLTSLPFIYLGILNFCMYVDIYTKPKN